MNEGKILPQATDFEAAVLGAIIGYQTTETKNVLNLLKPQYFYNEKYKLICEAIYSLHEKSIPIDILTLIEKLRQNETLNTVGGPATLTKLMIDIPSSAHIENHFYYIYQKYLLRALINICQQTERDAYDDIKDCFDIFEKHKDQIDLLDPNNTFKTSISQSIAIDNLNKSLTTVDSQNNIILEYNIKSPIFDENVTLGRNKILLLGGPAGVGKSKFVEYLIFSLLECYPNDISVYYVTLEDSHTDIIINHISSKVFITSKNLKYRKYPRKYISCINEELNKIKKYDILWTDRSIFIKEIVNNFTVFCNDRKDKFCILVIDNLLSLNDRYYYGRDLNPMYDLIMQKLLECRQKTHGLIIPIHHFKDAQKEKSQKVHGYRPTLTDLKGTEALYRVPNQVLLMNAPRIYKDLMAEYSYNKDIQDIMNHMFIIDVAKNREGKITEESSMIYYFAELDYGYFKEIELVKKDTSSIKIKDVGPIPI